MTTFINQATDQRLSLDLATLAGKATKSLYFRKGYTNGSIFLSQRGNGAGGAGDVCAIDAVSVVVSDSLYRRIQILASK